MKKLLFSLLIFLAPTSALALTAAENVAIAEQLSKDYPAIKVSVVFRPVISGDKNPTIFRISPVGKANYGNLFLKGHYDIIYKPDTEDGLGSYLCDIADEFVRKQQKARADFLPPFKFKVGPRSGSIDFEISGDQETIRSIIYSIIRLWDYTWKNYGNFNILVRGYADRGPLFTGSILTTHPIDHVSYFPLEDPKDPLLAVYIRQLETKKIGKTYTNAELPNLRATFLKVQIDRFLKECSQDKLKTESFVLDGTVIDTNDPEYRTIDLYFYAYQP